MMFSISGMAQNLLSKLYANMGKAQQINERFSFRKLPTAEEASRNTPKPAKASALTEVPSTAKKIDSYYMGYDYASDVGVCTRITETCYYIDGNTVYLPNVVYASYGENTVYLKGTLDASAGTVTVEPGQVLVDVKGTSTQLVAYKADDNTAAALTSENITYDYDSEDGSIYLEDGTSVGMYASSDLTANGLVNLFTVAAFSPKSANPSTESWKYTYKDLEGYDKEATVQVMQDEDMLIMKGLMPDYPDAWEMGGCLDETAKDIYIPSGQMLKDDVVMCSASLSGSSVTTIQYMILYNEATKNTYSSVGDSVIVDLYATESGTLGYSCLYSDLVLTAPSAGINGVNADKSEAAAVAESYYDLLGRRIDGNYKGVCIKQTRFADGTSKAVKVVR